MIEVPWRVFTEQLSSSELELQEELNRFFAVALFGLTVQVEVELAGSCKKCFHTVD